MKSKRTWITAAGVMALLAAVAVLALLMRARPEPVSADLPDGTRFRLAQTAYTNSFQYTQQFTPSWLLPFTPFIPDRIENRFLKSGSTLGLGNSTRSNLMLVVEATNDKKEATDITRLRIRDNQGNVYDGNGRNGMMSTTGQKVGVFIASVFPKRSEELFAEFLIETKPGTWTNIGPFPIPNPEFKDYPQWTPEPLPQRQVDDDFVATLKRFQSGPQPLLAEANADMSVVPRSVLLDFEFGESGVLTDEYRVHRVTLSDATGNKWSPRFNPIKPLRNQWVTNGTALFVGGVWPGEDAWKINLEVIRERNHSDTEVWNVPPIKLPSAGSFNTLTHQHVLGSMTNRVAAILAPGVQVTNQWQWTVRYWGNDRNVYPVAIESLGRGDRRPVLLSAKSESGAAFRIVEHRGANSANQCIFVEPPAAGATELHLKIAFPEMKKLEFLAKPEFVDEMVARVEKD